MRQLQFIEPGVADWRDVPEPELDSPAAALVRPIAVATCDLDGPIVRGELPLAGPFPLGHEFVAEVVAVGPDVRTVAAGDRVSVPFQVSCGHCARCRAGQTGRCATASPGAAYGLGPLGGTGDWGGAVADLLAVPYADAMCLPLPADLDPATLAGLSDNLVDAWRTVVPHLAPGGRAEHDRRILVLGNASIGLYATAIAVALGAEVTYVDSVDRNARIAESLGATVIREPADRYRSHPVVVHTTATETGLRAAIASTGFDGVCTDTGLFSAEATLPLPTMYARGITFVTGAINARASMSAALELIVAGRLDPAPIVATTADWADAPRAWAAHRGRLALVRD